MKAYLHKAFGALALVALSLLVSAPSYAFDMAVSPSTVTGAANAATCANAFCVVTTESVSTAAGATYTETVTATPVTAASLCFASVAAGGTGTAAVAKVTPAAGSLVIIVQNIHASVAFNAALVITYACFK